RRRTAGRRRGGAGPGLPAPVPGAAYPTHRHLRADAGAGGPADFGKEPTDMNERLNEINGELKKLNEALARQSQLEAQLKDLQEQRAEREQRVMDTSRVFWEEQEDVDKLEKGGLRSLLLSITGDKEARLSQERREALAAKLQYDQARRDLEDIDGRIRAVLGEKDSLRIDRIRRDALLEEKGELLKQMGGAAGARLTELDQRL